jgi:hypothetical protein
MTIDAHTKLGHYEIISSIGAGGMGEVSLPRTLSCEKMYKGFLLNLP